MLLFKLITNEYALIYFLPHIVQPYLKQNESELLSIINYKNCCIVEQFGQFLSHFHHFYVSNLQKYQLLLMQFFSMLLTVSCSFVPVFHQRANANLFISASFHHKHTFNPYRAWKGNNLSYLTFWEPYAVRPSSNATYRKPFTKDCQFLLLVPCVFRSSS